MLSFGRKVWLPLVLLALAALFSAAQTQAYSKGHLSTLQQPALFLVRPFQGCLSFLRGAWNSLTAGGLDKQSLAEDNQTLKQQVELLTVRNAHLLHIADENKRLRLLLNMKQHDPSGARWVAADVVERHPSHWFDILTLDQGADAGIKQHSVVMTAQGLVGQVILVRPDSCDVVLLTDPTSNAGATVGRTHDVGYVQGTGHEELTMSFFDRDHGIQKGDSVFSSPFSAVYPSGILIGKITAISADAGTAARTAVVRPAVEFNRLEEALVIP